MMVFEKVGSRDAAILYLKQEGEGEDAFQPCPEEEATLIKVTFSDTGETLWAVPTDEEPEDPNDVPDLEGMEDPDLAELERERDDGSRKTA